MKSAKDEHPVTEPLRRAILAHPMNHSELAKDADVPESTISRFLSGKRGISDDNIDNLCRVLKLELRPIDGR